MILPDLNWEKFSIGSDESGKGDFFGAPTVAAVKLDKDTLKKLKQQEYYYELKDSKSINNEKIKELAPKLMSICEYQKITLTPKEYNSMHSKYKNVNEILASLHNQVHFKIIGSETRIIDAFSSEQNYYKYLNKNNIPIQKIDFFFHKADSQYLSVALASIIARYYYIQQIENLRNQTGINIPFGNSYNPPNSVITTYKLLLEKGFSEEWIQNELAKSHFSTIKKIKENL